MIVLAVFLLCIILVILQNYKIKLISPITITLLIFIMYFVAFPLVEFTHGADIFSVNADLYIIITLIFFPVGFLFINNKYDYDLIDYAPRTLGKIIILTSPLFLLLLIMVFLTFAPITLNDVLLNPKLFRFYASNGGMGYVYFMFGVISNWTYLYLISYLIRGEINKWYLFYYLPFYIFFGFLSASSGFILNIFIVPILLYSALRKQLKISTMIILGMILPIIYLLSRSLKGGLAELPDFTNIVRNIISRFDTYELFSLYLSSNFSKNSPTFQAIFDFPYFYLPRSLFVNKPYFFQVEASQNIIFNDITYFEVTYSFSGIAEFIHSFTFIGLPVLGLFAGILLALNFRWFTASRSDLKLLLVYFWTFGSLSYSLIVDKVVSDLFMLPISFLMSIFYFSIFYKKKKKI